MCFNLSLNISFQVSQNREQDPGHRVSSNLRRASIYFGLHHPARGASSGGTTCLLCLALYAITFI
jgi:hypothetical protein